ncbi:MAG: N-acetylglucosamine-6-phosphate deacetylase [Clostridiales bacterium]|nr:N-acetylglucosamine-6-phosphate deacetylase [Clostridiales bacterium]
MKKVTYINAHIYNTAARRFECGSLTVENGIIVPVDETCDTVDLGGAYVVPGLIDVHTHGRGGFESTEVSTDEFAKMAYSYAKAGTTSFMPTLMSVPIEQLKSSIDVAVKASAEEKSGAHILGVHLEGRYLNVKKKGAHKPEYLAPLDADELAGLIDRIHTPESKFSRFHITCAPELEGGEAFVKRAVDKGATVSIGHSNATCAECEAAMEWGVIGFTHLYNAMSALTHRAPGCVGAGLSSDAYTELICDGCHVVPEVVRLTYRAKTNEKLVLITDSAPSAGLPEGKYTMGGADVIVSDAAYLLDGTLTGSVISMFKGVKNLSKFAGISIEEALPCATINPARMVGADSEVGSLEVGKRADFIITDKDFSECTRVFVGGEEFE